MPIIASAIKKLRHDRKRTVTNRATKESVREIVKSMRKKPSEKTLTTAFRTLDKAAKKNVIHKNKADRLKSRLAKLLK